MNLTKNIKSLIPLVLVIVVSTAFGQDFDKNLASAQSAYGSGDLSGARFAMEQMLSNVDAAIGKEILTLLPTAVGTLNYNQKDDNVTGSSAGAAGGLFVHRSYGMSPKSGTVDIINNSPMIAGINAMLNNPMMGSMMHNENQKTIKVQGYKAILQKDDHGDGTTGYEIQVPFNNTLLTFKLQDTTEDEITQLSNSIPLAKIAQMAQ